MAPERMEQTENNGGTEPQGSAAEPTPGGTALVTPPPAEPAAPPSFDEMLTGNRDYQAEFDRRVQQALTTARQNWEEQNRQDVDEATKLARMTETQRKEYLLDKDRRTLDADRAAFARQQLQVTVGSELQKRGLSADFAPWLTGKDAEASQANINQFETLWNTSITAAVNARMRSDAPPKDPKSAATLDREAIKRMSPTEINANWDKIKTTLENERKG